MAITKKRKTELVNQYSAWLRDSKGLVVTEYRGLSMKDLDSLRSKVREAGGEFHVVKNTLAKMAFDQAGLKYSTGQFEGSTAIAVSFQDTPALAKVIADFSRTSEFLTIKGGMLDNQPLSAENVKSLAELPPLPVMRAQLLGTILAPASQLARTLAEPGRQIAAVIKAYAEPEPSPAPA